MSVGLFVFCVEWGNTPLDAGAWKTPRDKSVIGMNRNLEDLVDSRPPEVRLSRQARSRNLFPRPGVNQILFKIKAEIRRKPCLICGMMFDTQVDHIVPIARYGEDSPENLQPLCGTCNRIKGCRKSNDQVLEWVIDNVDEFIIRQEIIAARIGVPLKDCLPLLGSFLFFSEHAEWNQI